jgi:predicted transcriptional regulator
MVTSWKLQRIVAGIPQIELAKRAQIGVKRLRRIERGGVQPSQAEVQVLSRALLPQRRQRPRGTPAQTNQQSPVVHGLNRFQQLKVR